MLIDSLSPPLTDTLYGTRRRLSIETLPSKGRCLIAKEDIPAGAILEFVPTIIVDHADCQHIDKTFLYNFYYHVHENNDETYSGIVALGLSLICNHAPNPNAEISFKRLTPTTGTATLTALRDIRKNEEITVLYGDAELWFEYEE